ncbi:MAG: hypothetical protein Q9O74_12760 [Planctomycetota bacterium]|nr:hypothetical protein [Planctomycetota bacterium]
MDEQEREEVGMFARDRDLLVLEPSLVRDIGWVGQRLVQGTGSIAGTTLTMTSQDVGFDDAGVDSGGVVVVGGVVYEVVAQLSASTLTISRMRGADDGAVLTPSPVTGVGVEVPTFLPQLAMVHGQVLRMLGIDPDEAAGVGVVSESSIVNPGSFVLLEALGTLHLVFAAASALASEGSPAAFKMGMYRERFAAERGRVSARIDTDGDGVADATRRPSVVQLVRA